MLHPLDYDGALDYLTGLGARFSQINESRSGSSDPDPLGDAKWPLLFVEEEPLAEEVNPSADEYHFAFQVLDKDPDKTTRELLRSTKLLGDMLVAQLRTEGVVVPTSKPSKLALAGTGSDSLATGWRYEIRLHVLSTLDRTTIAQQFAPYSPASS